MSLRKLVRVNCIRQTRQDRSGLFTNLRAPEGFIERDLSSISGNQALFVYTVDIVDGFDRDKIGMVHHRDVPSLQSLVNQFLHTSTTNNDLKHSAYDQQPERQNLCRSSGLRGVG